MTSIKTVPLLEGTKVIILNEGVNAMYARKLIAGWLKMYTDKDPHRTFDLLLFSDPKSTYDNESGLFTSSYVNIFDYYTVHNNEIDINVMYKKDCNSLEHIFKTINCKSTLIIDCLTSLISFVGLSKSLWFLEKLSNQVPQLFCIYRHSIVQNKIQCIETLGTTFVNIQKFNGVQINKNFNYVVEVVHRKVGGGLLQQEELVTQDSISFEILSKKLKYGRKRDVMSENNKQKIQSSFRIEVSDSELKQRKETVLPYMINTNTTNPSKILYQPEDIDDIDEEDPDDDLCF